MFARKVAVRLKPNSLREFTNLIECEILPWLRKQKGFLDLIILAAPDYTEVAALSFWDHQEDAQAYNASGYPEALNTLGNLFDSIPYVKTFEVVGSTLQGIEPSNEATEMMQETGPSQPAYRPCETQF